MKRALHTVSIIAVLLLAPVISAFKPAPPPKKITYSDESKPAVKLELRTDGWRVKSARVLGEKKPVRWKVAPDLPATAVVDAATRRVVLLGGYGDGCADLGKIAVYDFSGKLLESINLTTVIEGLEEVSREYTKICCPCRWVHDTGVESGELTINVCDSTRAIVSLAKPALRVESP